ncbi:MAG: TRAP transporter small permease subunit [Clostridia bacterium]|nr:TRAP transporter small permease subunit [Clostridia bacterium]
MKKKFSIEYFEDFICNAFLVIMLLAILVNVVLNWTMSKRFSYLEELATGSYMFCTYSGIGLLYKRRELTKVSFVVDRLSCRGRYIVDMIAGLYLVYYGAMMTYYGVLLCISSRIKRLPAMQISYTWLDICIVFGFFMLTVRVLRDIIRQIASAKQVFGKKEAD